MSKEGKIFFVGIDLSGPSNSKETVAVAFAASAGGYATRHRLLLGADDRDILYFVQGLRAEGDIIVGLDAPLSYNPGGGDRPADADLRREIIAAGLRSGAVMTPTMTRMVYLTLRGMAIARLLLAAGAKTKIVEVHPGGAMVLRGAAVNDVAAFKHKVNSRFHLLAWLEKQGLKGAADIQDPSDHYVAACACGLAAWKWFHDESVWIQPAKQPFHPFDYAC